MTWRLAALTSAVLMLSACEEVEQSRRPLPRPDAPWGLLRHPRRRPRLRALPGGGVSRPRPAGAPQGRLVYPHAHAGPRARVPGREQGCGRSSSRRPADDGAGSHASHRCS